MDNKKAPKQEARPRDAEGRFMKEDSKNGSGKSSHDHNPEGHNQYAKKNSDKSSS